jgi:hypothetical protein
MELGIWLSFVKTSEFRGGGEFELPKPHFSLGTPLHESIILKLVLWNMMGVG